MATKAYSLWIYDRHCTLIYHHDWSISPSSSSSSPPRPPLAPGPDLLPGVSRCVTTPATAAGGGARDGAASVGQGYPSGAGASSSSKPAATPAASSSSSSQLPLTEHAKLIYGLVFSLRNMLSKLSPTPPTNGIDPPQSLSSPFNTYTASTYSLAHLQTASMYTFVLLTDPVQPPSRGLAGRGAASIRPASALLGGGGGASEASNSAGSSASSMPTGGGIPGTGGMSLPGVLKQIVGGPWAEWVVRNPATTAAGHDAGKVNGSGITGTGGLEWEEMDDVELGEEDKGGAEDGEGSGLKGQIRRAERARGIDSDGFRSAVEAVLAQNKLSTVF